MVAQEYTVRLDAFEGPLDLLLYLIRRAEVDVTEISIARIADQYVAYLAEVDRVDVDRAGEFLVMAATIVEMKSRLVQAEEAGSGGGDAPTPADAGLGESAGAALVRQLLEYKAYRDAADSLEARREAWLSRYPSAAAAFDKEVLRDAVRDDAVELDDVSLMDLVEAFQRITETVQMDRLGDHQVVFDDTPIELHAADLLDQLERAGARRSAGAWVPFEQVLAGRTRGEMIGLFLALLEVVRQRRAAVAAGDDGIRLTLRDDDPPAEAEGAPRPEPPAGWDGDHILDDDEGDGDDDDLVE